MSGVPGAPLVVDRDYPPTNPFTLAAAIVGAVLIVLGLILALLPTDGAATSGVGPLLGSVILGLGGTVATAALLLAGIGWYLRNAPRGEPRLRVPPTGGA